MAIVRDRAEMDKILESWVGHTVHLHMTIGVTTMAINGVLERNTTEGRGAYRLGGTPVGTYGFFQVKDVHTLDTRGMKKYYVGGIHIAGSSLG